MKSFRIFPAVAFLACISFSPGSLAVIDNNAPAVKLQTSCTEGGVALNNCFEDTTTLADWLKTIRRPNAQNPLVVNIGAGEFGSLTLSGPAKKCDPGINYTGYISFVGSGPDKTTFTSQNPMTIGNCTNMSFSNMAIGNTFYGGYISWNGGGSSTWNNVVVDGQSRIWIESCGVTRGKHYWFGSRLKMTAAASIADGYDASCGESWFIGSEIQADLCDPNGGYGPNGNFLIRASEQGEIHVYGSVIRVGATCQMGVGTPILAITASDGGNVHVHGTGIDVISTVPNNIVVLQAASGGVIHANGAAYNLSTPSGTVTRISNNGGHIHAPYLWEHIPDPATIPNFTSANGADQTTVTSGTSDGHPHTVVYSTNCPANARWYDQVDKVCRP